MRWGEGVETYKNGDVFEGTWHGDMKNEIGTYNYYFGDKFTGNYENDRRHGSGTHIGIDGIIRKGEWSEGKLLTWFYETEDRANIQSITCSDSEFGLLQSTEEHLSSMCDIQAKNEVAEKPDLKPTLTRNLEPVTF